MQKIIIIIGLPGSGKSTYISTREEFSSAVICDDYHKSNITHSRAFEDSVYFDDLQKGLLAGKDVVISDIAFCRIERLNAIKEKIHELITKLGVNAEIEIRYFENNPGACIENVSRRNRVDRLEREKELIEKLSSVYQVPQNAEVIPVFKS